MNNKYNLDFSKEVIQASEKRLINQIWKLIPMKENSEDWQNQITKVIIEILGLQEIFLYNAKFLILSTNAAQNRLKKI